MDLDLSELGLALEAAGFTHQSEAVDYFTAVSEDLGLSANGPHRVHACWVRGQTVVLVEQNTAPDNLGGGITALVTHPPVAVIEGPRGRVAASPADVELVVSMAKDVSRD